MFSDIVRSDYFYLLATFKKQNRSDNFSYSLSWQFVLMSALKQSGFHLLWLNYIRFIVSKKSNYIRLIVSKNICTSTIETISHPYLEIAII